MIKIHLSDMVDRVIFSFVLTLLLAILFSTANINAGLTNHNITLIQLHQNLTGPSSESVFCPEFPTNPSKTLVLGILNETANETVVGECALDALSFYNASGILKSYNISINITALNANFIANGPILNATNITSFSITNQSNMSMCVKVTPKSGNANMNAYKIHVHSCNSGWLKNSIVVNITFPKNASSIIKFNITDNEKLNNAPIATDNPVPDPSLGSSLQSINWAGYVATSSSSDAQPIFTGISGSWVVQNALQSLTSRDSAQWIGIGGMPQLGFLNDKNLIQIGTASCRISNSIPSLACPYYNIFSNNGPHYYLWDEVLPFGPYQSLGLEVNPGDNITARIQLVNKTHDMWIMVAKDLNTGSTLVTNPFFYPSSMNSADWIDERPSALLGGYQPLTNFINTSFTNSYASYSTNTSTNITKPLGEFWDTGTYMIDNQNTTIANVSAFSDGSVFKVSNFRVASIKLSNISITQEQSTIAFDTAYGGTGNYSFRWVEELPSNSNLVNASNCIVSNSKIYKNQSTTFCDFITNSSTPTGTYMLELRVEDPDSPGEVVYSSPVEITVTPATRPILSSVPIMIINSQRQTAAPFQQMIRIDSTSIPKIASNWSNVEFTTGPNATGTALQSWVESGASNSSLDTVVWLKFPNGLQSGDTIIYMNMMSNPVMSASGPTGEAPQLSPVYGQYDNGNIIFNYYNNFANSTNGWAASSGVSVSAFKGLSITFNQNGYFVGPSENSGTAFDADIVSDAEDNIGYINTAEPVTFLGGTAWAGTVIREACGNTYPDQISQSFEANGCGIAYGSIIPGTETATGIFTIVPYSSTSSFQYINYSEGQRASHQPITTDAPGYPANIGFAQMRNGAQLNSIGAQWVRVRNAPPNGIMPSYQIDPFNIVNSTTTISTTATSTITSTASGSTTNTTSTTTTTI